MLKASEIKKQFQSSHKITKKKVFYPPHYAPNHILPATFHDYRYLIGQKGKNPLICVCMNPSSAQDGYSDMTVNKIINQAIVNNYDGWYVLNIYPERATWAKTHLSSRLNRELHQRNLKEIKDLLQKNKISEIWGAWGDIDTKRKWLEDVKNDVIRTIKDTGVKIFYFDELTKKFNNPRHPLYIKIDFSKKRYL